MNATATVSIPRASLVGRGALLPPFGLSSG